LIRLYLSGPMTGLPECNKESFMEAEIFLRECGYEVLNPWLLDNYRPKEMTWAQRVQDDIKVMMICNAVAILPGWLNSRGARLETELAHTLGWKIKPVEDWIKEAKCPTSSKV
jgi:Domain of unknown function (DUF4406)